MALGNLRICEGPGPFKVRVTESSLHSTKPGLWSWTEWGRSPGSDIFGGEGGLLFFPYCDLVQIISLLLSSLCSTVKGGYKTMRLWWCWSKCNAAGRFLSSSPSTSATGEVAQDAESRPGNGPPWFAPWLDLSTHFQTLFFCLFLLGLHPQHTEVPRLGVELKPQLPAYATATAMPDPSHICNLHHSSRQCRILNPPSEARDRTCILRDASQIHFHCATTGTLPDTLYVNFSSHASVSPSISGDKNSISHIVNQLCFNQTIKFLIHLKLFFFIKV